MAGGGIVIATRVGIVVCKVLAAVLLFAVTRRESRPDRD